MLYRLFFRIVLQRIDAERAHALAATSLRVLTTPPFVRAALRRWLGPPAELRVERLGLTFPTPLGVPAGVDKGATWFEALGALGFGFVEVGTVTALGQPGNPQPRVFRLPRDRALLNSMGFPNPGADAAATALRRRTGETVVAANVGKSKVAGIEAAGEDYRASVRRLAPLCDFVVLNVSSPNTPGLRDMQSVSLLRLLVADVRAELHALGQPALPLLVKIAPDLADEDIDAIADLALELELHGLIAVNTTISRASLSSPPELTERLGGISGAPLKARAIEVLERLHRRAGDRLVLISVGGVESADDAWARILAGASLVQAYTGFVYGGPLWPSRLNRQLAERMRADGFASIDAAVGAGTTRA